MIAAILIPKWLVDEHAITLATWGLVFVTLLLVIFTGFLYLDSWTKGKEQRARWKREDEQHDKDLGEERGRWKRDDEVRLESQRPKPAFGLDLRSVEDRNEAPVTIWCSNLGLVPFHIETVLIRRMTDIDVLEADKYDAQFDAQMLVNVGEMIRLHVSEDIFRGLLLTVDIEVRLLIATADSRVTTDGKIYSIWCPDSGRVAKVERGFHENRTVKCQQCESIGFLDPNGLSTKVELLQVMAIANRELSATCPVHDSTVLRSILNPQGVRTWSRDKGVSVARGE